MSEELRRGLKALKFDFGHLTDAEVQLVIEVMEKECQNCTFKKVALDSD